MDLKKIVSNFTIAFLAQAISLLLSFVTSLIVPKLLGVEQFGYWQLFIFYSSYAGLFHFGLNDGVYLIYGGQSRSSINKEDVSCLFRIEIFFQFLLSIILVALSLLYVPDKERLIVISATGIYITIFNLSNYIWCLFQAINETKLYSISIIISKLSFLVLLVILLFYREHNFQPYIFAFILSQICALIYCIAHGRALLFANVKNLNRSIRLLINTIKVGIKLTLSNLAAMLTVGFARFVVDNAWGIEKFGQFSLAISLVNFALMFVTQLAMVLYPALRQSNASQILHAFSFMRSLLSLFLPVIYVFFFPVSWLLEWWLPSYSDAFYYFGLLLPICLFDSKMNLVGVTFLKVKRREKVLLLINVCTVLLTIILVLISVYSFHSITFVSFSLAITMCLRGIYTEKYVEKLLDAKVNYIVVWECVISISFILSYIFIPSYACWVVVFIYLLIIYFNKTLIYNLINSISIKRKDSFK